MFSKSTLASLLAFAASTFAVRNSIYVIHEVESPGLGLDGLTPIGVQRANTCIPNVFRNKGIGKIISCTPDLVTGACWTAVSTVTPLAEALGLEVDTSCGNGEDAEDDCVTNLIDTFAATSTKAILLVWDAGDEDTLFENLGVELPESEDDDGGSIYHHDEYITIRNEVFIGFSSQDCPDIDGQAPGTGIFSRVQNTPTNPSPDTTNTVDTKVAAPPAESSAPAPAPAAKEGSVARRAYQRRVNQKRQPRQRRTVSRIYA